MAYVYGHYTLDGRLFYIGKGTGKRAWIAYNRNSHWNRVKNKHGIEIRILKDELTDEQAYKYEQELILLERENPHCYLTNISDGGEYPPPFSKGNKWDASSIEKREITKKHRYETDATYREMLKEANKKVNTPERNKKISEWRKSNPTAAMLNIGNLWKGKHLPDEMRKKQSVAARQRPKFSCPHCGKIMQKCHLVQFGHINARCMSNKGNDSDVVG